MKTLSTLLLATICHAQVYKPDKLIDDFHNITLKVLFDEPNPLTGAKRYHNVADGDYGSVGAPFVINTVGQYVEITAEIPPPAVEVPGAPPAAPATNFFFAKFDAPACFDLTGYTAISFDLIAPVGTTMQFTLTQKAADCVTRLVDSVYSPLSKYITPNGQKQKVVLPITDFALNSNGVAFDMKHLKDWTMTNIQPVGAVLRLSNFVLVGSGGANAPAPKNGTVAGTNPDVTGSKNNAAVLPQSSFMATIINLLVLLIQ